MAGQSARASAAEAGRATPEHVDVLIVGAGISGIGAAYHLQRDHPGRSYLIAEQRTDLGGTWDLFRYPGIRSDSDLFTFSYTFRPWTEPEAIAEGGKILDYVRATAAEYGIDRHIAFRHAVVGAAWSSDDARWTVQLTRTDADGTAHPVTVTASWVFAAGGYYRYEAGFTPEFAGREDFRGQIVHPQAWPEDLDYAGKKVVIIGSGATAVTLAPAMAERGGEITVLQRTPTYMVSLPRKERLAIWTTRLLGVRRAFRITRWKNIVRQMIVFRFAQRFPRITRALIRAAVKARLPKGYPVDTHFKPPYDPWDQRLCVVPDGDFFREIRAGRVEMVTDRIERFDERGIVLASGAHLDADVIITATGLDVQPFGGVPISVDGEDVDLAETVVYKGMMLSGVPNLAFAIGYTNSSWTLKIDLLCEHFGRILELMDSRGAEIAVPEAPAGMATRPFFDFGAGYIRRAEGRLPRQGDRAPWLTSMSYWEDVKLLRRSPVADDENLHLRRRPDSGAGADPAAARSGTAAVGG